jgi:hypothetical protein
VEKMTALQSYIEQNPSDPELWIYEMFVTFEKENIRKIEAYRKAHPEHKDSILCFVLDENCNSVITEVGSDLYKTMWDTGKDS